MAVGTLCRQSCLERPREQRINSPPHPEPGGASGKIKDQPTSFADYLAARAAASGGTVTDAAGNDITNAKPTYKVQEGAWGAPEDTVYDNDPLDWIDKSVSGFEKQETDWLVLAPPPHPSFAARRPSELSRFVVLWEHHESRGPRE